MASGDLLVQGRDVRIAGTGLDLNVARAYNSETNEGATDFGGFWAMESGADVRVAYNSPASGDATFYGPSGYSNVLTPNGSGGFNDPNGLNATLVHNANGTSTLTFFETGEVYSFNAAGQLVSDVDKHGNTVSYGYSGGNLSTITDTRKRTLNVTENSSGQITKITDPTGRTWTYSYSGTNLLSSTDPLGNTTTYGYTGSNLLSQITDPDGNTTQISYGSGGQVASISRAAASSSVSAEVTKFSYNLSPSSPCPAVSYGETTVTNPDGANTIYCWDSTGRVISSQNADGHSSTQSWGADDLPTTSASPDQTTAGVNTTLAYNGANALTGITKGTGANSSIQESLGYNTGSSNTDPYKAYDPSSETDAQGNTTTYSYDGSGDMTSVQNPLGAKDTMTYNAQGELTGVTDPLGHSRSYGYDSLGELTTITPPQPSSLKPTTITYDGLSRIATVTDGKGQKTTYAYNADDQVTQVTYADGSTVAYSYNGDGDLTTETTTTVPNSPQKISYSYDNVNRQTQATYPTYTATYGYDAAGRLTSFNDGGGAVSYVYDPAGLLTSLTDPTGKTTFGYNNDGQRTSTTYPDGTVETVSVNPAGEVTGVSTANSAGTVLTSDSYTYGTSSGSAGGPDELVASRVDNLGNMTNYSYDSANELLDAKTTNSAGTVTDNYQYTYDLDGNHTQQTTMYNGGAATTQTLAYNAANQICWSIVGTATPSCSSPPANATSFTYDADGNELGATNEVALTYNAANQLTSEQDNPNATVNKYAYLGAGQGDRTQDGSTTFQNTNLGISASTTGTANTVYYTRDPQGLVIDAYYVQSSNHYNYIYDGQGNVIALDKSGALSRTYKYGPNGSVSTDSGSLFDSALRFHGAWNGSGNLYHFGARDFDPILREWTQEDPLNQPEDLSQENAYDYAGNDPINAFDPTGRNTILDSLGLGSGAVATGCGIAGAATEGAGYVACGIIGGTISAATGIADVFQDIFG